MYLRETPPIRSKFRACLKTSAWAWTPEFGVPPSGGFGAGPPKGGTPNRILKHALKSSRYPFANVTEEEIKAADSPCFRSARFASRRSNNIRHVQD